MPRQIDLHRLQDDFAYYAATLLVIKPKLAQNLCRLRLNAPQRLLYHGVTAETPIKARWREFAILDHGWKYYDERNLPLRQYILKARQEGVSTLGMGRLFHRAHTRPGTNCMLVAQDDEATSTVFQMARMFYSFLPELLKPKTKNSNARELLFQEPDGPGGLNSWIRIQTAGGKSIGRSKTVHHLMISEASYWPDPESVVDGLFQAVPPLGNTSIIIETTAKGMGTWAYNAWFASKEARQHGQRAAITPVFIPWFLLPEYQAEFPTGFQFSDEDRELHNFYDLSWEQVFWYNYIKRAEFELAHPGQGEVYLKTEYPSNDLECWSSGLNAAFPTERVQEIYTTQVRLPLARYAVRGPTLTTDRSGALLVWEKPQPGVQYAMGVDTAHGIGGDNSCIQVLAHPGYRQVAEWSDNQTGPKELAAVIETIARWYNEAVVAVEVNGGSGLLCNSTLWETYSNLYRWEYFDKAKQAETQRIGWETTLRTKTLLIDHTNSLLVPQLRLTIRSERVAFQMRQLILNPLGGGTADYLFLKHTGDELMAYMIALMCLWRKIARFDYGEETGVPVAATRLPHEYDQGAADLLSGLTTGDAYARSWLSH